MMSGWTVEDSVFDKAANGIQIGGGRRNRVLNNHFCNVAGSAVSLLVSPATDFSLSWMCRLR